MTRITPSETGDDWMNFLPFAHLFDASPNWWKIGSGSASAISVTGFVLTLLQKANWTAAGFGSLGVLSILAFYSSDELNELDELKKTAKKLAETKDRLVKAKKEWGVSVSSLEDENRKLKSTSQGLQKVNQGLKETNEGFKKRIADLEKINIAFSEKNEVLKTEVSTLKGQVLQFRRGLGILKQQVGQFITADVALGKQLGTLSRETQRLSANKNLLHKDIDKLDASISKDIKALALQLLQGRTLADKNILAMQQQKQGLEELILKLRNEFRKIQQVKDKLVVEGVRYQNLEATLLRKNRELAAINLSIASNRRLLSSEGDRFSELQRKIAENQRELNERTKQLEQLKKTFEAVLAQLRSLEPRLQAKVEQFERLSIQMEKIKAARKS